MTKRIIFGIQVAIFGVLVAGLTVACQAPPVNTPADFARLQRPGYGFKYRAISSDEVTIALKKRKNDPMGDLLFWGKVLKDKIPLVYGYSFVGEEDIATDLGVHGKLLNFEVAQEDGKYLYLIGVFVQEKKMWLFEAGGREAAFKARQKAIHNAIKSMNI